MEFKKLKRASRSPEGYRLATVNDVRENWKMIQKLGILDTWSILRLVDGVVNGAGYGNELTVKWISIRLMGEMLLVKSPDESTISGHNSRIRENLYSRITLDKEGKKVALALACDDKNLEIIYWILQNTDESELHTLTAFVAKKLKMEKSPLHYIAEADMNYEDDEIVSVAKLLISKYEVGKRTVAARENYERTFLHFASLCGRPGLCQFLIENHHLRADTEDRFGQNALHFAAARGPQNEEEEMVAAKLLRVLSEGSGEGTDVKIVDSRDGKQRTPLHIAASTGYTQMVEQLLQWRGNTEEYIRRADIFGQTALLAAVRGGHKEVVGKLLEYGSHPLYERDSEGNTSLHLAVRLEDESVARDIIQVLSEKRESEQEKSLLLWASATGMGTAQDVSRFSSVTELLRKERNAISSDKNLLRTAATLGNKEMSRELLHGGANIEDIKDQDWQQKLGDQHRKIVEKVISCIEFIPERGREQPATMDNLGRKDFALGLAALFLNPYIKTPITVGISGEWGMGKSSLMLQTENIMLITAAQQAFPHLFIQIENFPGARKISLNKKGIRMHNKITTAVRMLLGTQKLKELKEDPVAHVLKEYQPQYDALFKSLACMDRSDMGNKEVPGGPSILTVRYNAWHYRNECEAWAGLAVTITREIEARMTAAQSLTTRYRYAWKTQRGSIYLELIIPGLFATIIAVCIAWAAITLLFRSNRKELQGLKYGSVPATLIAIVWAALKSVISVIKPISTQMRRYLTLPENSERLGYQQKVIDDITFLREEISRKPKRFFSFIAGEWCWNWFGMCHNNFECAAIPKMKPASKDNLRIIVFVDDLDRCEEKIILKVLSAVNLVLAACEISVIMGIDNRMIARAIIKEFKHEGETYNLEDLAENYIRKIIQLPLALPDPNDAESKSFLGALLGPSNQEDTSQGSHENSHHPEEDTSSSARPDACRISIHSGDCPADKVNVEEDACGLIHRSGKAILSCFLKMQNWFWFAHNENEHKGNEPGNVLWTRKIMMVNYSNSEREAFEYLRGYATGTQKVPREWKRLLNYHRLAWAILVINSMNTKSLLPSGWPVQLVAWIFACWQWKCQLNFIILRWQKDIGNVKQSELETSDAGPSLRDIVEHYIEKMWPRKPNLDSNNGALQIGSSQETHKIEKQQKQGRKQEQKEEEWRKLGEVLKKYDVTMTSIQRFQRFRLHCKSGHLPWPLPT